MSLSCPTTRAGLAFSACLATLAVSATVTSQEDVKLLPGDGGAGDVFGSAVATDGALVAVGAPTADQSGANSGSAYVFAAWSGNQLLELVPSNGAAGDQLGASIGLDGARVAVGAPLADRAGADSGTVYVFDATTGSQMLELAPADGAAGDQFGYAVAIDGGLVVVGALGAAYLFDASTGDELEKLLPSGGSTTLGLSGFGEAVDIDAGIVVVGARLENGVSGISGAAYVFDAAGGDQLHRLIATNGTAWAFFGACVSIDNGVIAIGAPEAGPNGKHSGAAYLFDASTGQQDHYLFPSSSSGGHIFAKFGSSVAVDGRDVFIGSDQNHVGAAASAGSVFHYDAVSGSRVGRLVASDPASGDDFGAAAAAAGGVLVSGAPRDDDQGNDSGSAYVFGATANACQPDLGFQGPGTATASLCGTGLSSGESSDYEVFGAPGAAAGALFISIDGSPNVPVLGGTLVSFGGFAIQAPLIASGAGTVSLTFGGLPNVLDLVFQSVFIDSALPRGIAFTNAIRAEYGR